ncbi:MAG: ribonuclease HII [Pontixanthobacter sp.]
MMAGAPVQAFDTDAIVIGVDEAGRGPLAGPVVAGAVVLGKRYPDGLDDSKKLTARRRAQLDLIIRDQCVWAVGIVDVADIDRLNILGATMLAMTRAVGKLVAVLRRRPDEILIDGNMYPSDRCADWDTAHWGRGRAIVGGDGSEPAIGAASIVAKEWRDRMMCAAAADYPQYGWARNKGYGTREHLAALHEYGATPLHRTSFAPVAQLNLM